MPAGKGGKESGEGPIKYVVGLGAFDDGTWVGKAGAALPKLGTISVISGGSTNSGNGGPKQKPSAGDREGAVTGGSGGGPPGGHFGNPSGDGGGGSGSITFSFIQTQMPCAGCGWLFTSSRLVVKGSNGTATANGPGFLVKVGRGTPTIKFGISQSSVGTVTSARLYLPFNTREGLANGDYSSIVKVFGNGRHIATFSAGQVKQMGYSKSNPGFNFDVTSFIKSAL
jgi:hypothetical protein